MSNLRKLDRWIGEHQETVREVGKLFKSVRLKSQLSQEEFATELGVTGVWISKIETGVAIPSHDLMIKLRDYMREAPWWT